MKKAEATTEDTESTENDQREDQGAQEENQMSKDRSGMSKIEVWNAAIETAARRVKRVSSEHWPNPDIFPGVIRDLKRGRK